MTKTLDTIIAGALYDFAAHLSLLKTPITIGNNHDASPICEILGKFMEQRGLDSTKEPMVKDWHLHCCQPPAWTALNDIKDEMTKDYGYAWSWHSNIAMSMHDSIADSMVPVKGSIHAACNQGAARFMYSCFGIDTTLDPSGRDMTKE